MPSPVPSAGAIFRAVLAGACAAGLIGGADVHAGAPAASACGLVGAPPAAWTMQVPFEQVDGRIYVRVRVNGRGPFQFAIDTGASGLGRADSSLVAALDLPLLPPTANADGVATGQAETTRLDTIELGGLARSDVRDITRDYSSGLSPEAALSGIIARDYFADGLLLIDYRAKTVAFSTTLALVPGRDGVLSYERPFRVPVSIAGVQTEGNLDTGANVAFVLPLALFEQVGGTPLQQAGQGQLANTRITTQRSTVHGPFRIGLALLADVEVRVSDRYPELLVGAHALQGFAVLIDQRSRSVALCP